MSAEDKQSRPQTPAPSPPKRKHNHDLWLGPSLVFAGSVSYFLVMARVPLLRDFPWANLPIVLLGLLLSARALRRAFHTSTGTPYRGRILAIPGLLLSTAMTGLFCFYVFYWTYQMPAPQPRTLNLARVPEVTLPDTDGRLMRLSDLRGRKVILTFYRGYW